MGFGKSVYVVFCFFFLIFFEGVEIVIYLVDSFEVMYISGVYFYKKCVIFFFLRVKDEWLVEEFWDWSMCEVGL